ncbi:GNAT family N-acetyltransferase [Paracoccus seriniphilus]|uniref:GNAT family N-acetyltransferase n=1 Tax=Paracoccus seriniphilus TaxID=184748 RepID=UPI003561D155
MPDSTLTITPFEATHLPGALALSRAESWPHRAEDWQMFLSLSRGVVALAGDQVAGTALATRFGQVGLVNMIIVGEALRGRGLGRTLVQRAMETADVAEYRLVATQAGLPLYRKMGFADLGEIVQHQGQVAALEVQDDGISWATAADSAALAALDQQATGMARKPLVDAILSLGQIAALSQDGQITAWAGIRPFGRGLVAGPVIAPDSGTAQRLLSRLMADHPGSFIRVDTQADSGLSDWLTSINLTRAGGGVSMSTAPQEPSGPNRSFALAAQALG